MDSKLAFTLKYKKQTFKINVFVDYPELSIVIQYSEISKHIQGLKPKLRGEPATLSVHPWLYNTSEVFCSLLWGTIKESN